jgi:PKD repeat protein
MPQLSVGRRLLVVAFGVMLALVVLCGPAHADEYGELARIGSNEAGTASGHFAAERTRLLGVDPTATPTRNGVYVLDEPEKFSQSKKAAEPEPACKENELHWNEELEKCEEVAQGPLTRHFRIQKFNANEKTGVYSFSASVLFNEAAPEPQAFSGATFAGGVEGIALDSELKRLYVLTADNRENGIKVDSKSPDGSGVLAASTLYAFSTVGEKEGTEGKLKPAEGTNAEGVLTSASVLEAQSKTAGKALLGPTGITVDPKTHDVIVLGHVDEAGGETDDIAGAGDRYALERIGSDGKLGARYVDKTNFFKQEYFPFAQPQRPPDSPTVVSVGGGVEHLYVNFKGLVDVPENFASSEAPHTVAPALTPPYFDVSEPGVGTAAGPLSSMSHEVASWTGAAPGAALSAAPEGTVYGAAEIRTEEEGAGDRRDGVLAFNSSGAELGWTGGQTPELKGGKERVPCALQPAIGALPELGVRIAAGGEGKVFALNPEFMKRTEWEGVEEPWTKEAEEEQEAENGKEQLEKSPKPFYAPIVEFGPKGSGCPHTRVSPPEARAGGEPLGEQSVPAGSPVTFTSELVQGDALNLVEWVFTDVENEAIKETEKVTTDKWTHTTAIHVFEHEGTFKVKEIVHSNDLATQVVEQEAEKPVHISEAAVTTPSFVFSPLHPLVNQVVTFTDPSTAGIVHFKWSFGDGSKAETTTGKTTHAYTKAGPYTVELVVANAKGKESPAGVKAVTVSEEEAPPTTTTTTTPPPAGESPSGGGSGGGGGSTGVLSYRVSVASTSLPVSRAGAFNVKVNCLGQSVCAGSVSLRTLTAVSAGKKRKAILTLATGSFSIAGGQAKSLSLHLSAKARALLARVHVLRAKLTIAGHDSANAPHTTTATVTLRVAKAKH